MCYIIHTYVCMYVLYTVHWNWNQQKQSIEYTQLKYNMIDLCTSHMYVCMYGNMYLCTCIEVCLYVQTSNAFPKSCSSCFGSKSSKNSFDSWTIWDTHIVPASTHSSSKVSHCHPTLRRQQNRHCAVLKAKQTKTKLTKQTRRAC